ncbi:Phage envelope protein [Klebsiella pneumoniae]|uniref:Phage envelope protein n=1 Tax=Klebsiella pneumoniae TaxID=573 RepID=A0A4P0Y5E7_KLEPN|nr:Phage envelope protein [Klebsiella pneumoniae]
MELLVRLGHFFEQARSDADYATFANELRRHQVSYYIYFVSTGNMNFVMANDEVVSVKSARGLLRVRAEPAIVWPGPPLSATLPGPLTLNSTAGILPAPGYLSGSSIWKRRPGTTGRRIIRCCIKSA